MTMQAVAFDYAEMGSGTALLFLPGSFGTGAGWKAVMEHLGDGYRMVTTSLLGYGSTPDIRPDGNATMAQQVGLIVLSRRWPRSAGLQRLLSALAAA